MSEVLDPPISPQPPLPRMTYEEFLAWADEDTHAEWVDGEVILMSPVAKVHQLLAQFLASILGEYAAEDWRSGADRSLPNEAGAAPSGP